MSEASEGKIPIEDEVNASTVSTDLKPENGAAEGALEVADGSPPWLTRLVSSLPPSDLQTNELFVVLLFVIVHEMGFTLEGEGDNPSRLFDISVLRNLKDMRAVKRSQSSYYFNLRLDSCPIVCSLVLVPTSDIFIVNFLVQSTSQIKSVSFEAGDYVSTKDGSFEFTNLKRLSYIFKGFLHGVRNMMLDLSSLPVNNLITLPYEILFFMSKYLDYKSFVNFSCCCKPLYGSLFIDEQMWKRLFKIQFNSQSGPSNSCSWKKHFIDQSIMKKRRTAKRPVRVYEPSYVSPPLYYMRPIGHCNVRL